MENIIYLLPYFFLLIVVLLIANFADLVKSNKIVYDFFKGIVLIILVLFAGLRNDGVGVDTPSYTTRFETTDYNLKVIWDAESGMELGYRLLEYVASLFSDNYVMILIVTALVTVSFQLKGIYKISEKPVVSLFVLICFGIFTFVFNGARQALAAGVYMYAIYFMLNGKFWKYAFWVFIASLFHKSVIIAIPLYFLFRIPFSKKLMILFVAATGVAVLSFRVLVSYASIINEKYAVYQEMDAQGGAMLTLAYSGLCFFFIYMRENIIKRDLKKYDLFLNIYIFGTMVFVAVLLSGAYVEMTRTAFYFTLSAVFLWPIILKNLDANKIIAPMLLFVFFHLIFFVVFLVKIGGLLPYKLNPEYF